MVDRGLLARKDEFRSNQSKVRLSEAGLANLNKPVGEYDENREQPISKTGHPISKKGTIIPKRVTS